MHRVFSQLFTFSDPLQVLKSLLMSGRVESGVLDEGDSAGVLQDSFETTALQRHVLKCDSFLTNNCMHAQF